MIARVNKTDDIAEPLIAEPRMQDKAHNAENISDVDNLRYGNAAENINGVVKKKDDGVYDDHVNKILLDIIFRFEMVLMVNNQDCYQHGNTNQTDFSVL